MCGKNATRTQSISLTLGSPPRVREKPFSFTFLLFYRRITPACAGKTPVKFYRQCIDRDHPRVCGKNDQNDLIVSPRVGSPPRVREKHRMFHVDCLGQRITPACAGKTWSLPSCLSAIQDHPRVCGKNPKKISLSSPRTGSPPRVREKPSRIQRVPNSRRITPACAGKTHEIRASLCNNRDHPRVCGKNFQTISVSVNILGSPPRVREKLECDAPVAINSGITPACAGKTPNLSQYN